jgi:hypothetical protein
MLLFHNRRHIGQFSTSCFETGRDREMYSCWRLRIAAVSAGS